MHKRPKRLCHWISKKRPESSLILFTLMTMIAIFPGSLPLEAVNVPVAEGRRHVTIQKPTVEGHDAAQVVGDAKTGFLVLYPSKPTGATDQSFTVEVIALLPQGMSEEDKKKVSARMIDEEGVIIVGGAPRAEGQTLKIELKVASPSSHGRLALTFDDKATDHPACNVNLLPVDLKVDANRDGEITGADQTTPATPYRFWINSDADEQEDEEPTGSSIDYLNNTIDTRRDLEDFSRLWFNIGGFHEQLKSGEAQLGFKWTETTGNPRVKIYWAADENGSDNYLKEEADASAQISGAYNSAVAIPSGGNTAFVDKKVFENIDSADGWVYFLFEGSSEGKGKLTSVLKLADSEEFEVASADINLMHVRKMYERVKVTPSPADAIADPPGAVNIGWTWDPWNHPPEYDPEEEDQYLVFVHGWNMTYSGAQKFGETMFKRLWHQGYKGRYAFVRWPTYFGVLTYNDSDYRAWKSGIGLASFVNSLPIQYERKLCAHSMGNVVASSALREGMNVDYYGLLNAAVPAMCYDSSTTLYSNYFATPDGDIDPATNALGFKNKINAVNGANLINFYLPQDHALGIWTVNNFSFKPDSNKGYTYDPLENSGEKLYKQGFVSRRYLTDFHEAGAFATKSRTHTVGALGHTNGVIGSKVNLDAKYNFGDIHSAEWELNSQGTFDFYSDLMDEMFLD